MREEKKDQEMVETGGAVGLVLKVVKVSDGA